MISCIEIPKVITVEQSEFKILYERMATTTTYILVYPDRDNYTLYKHEVSNFMSTTL